MEALEKHYTIREIADALNLSEEVVRPMFAVLPGVLAIERPALLGKRKKRKYTTLRVPESVLAAWHDRHSGRAPAEVQTVGGIVQQPLMARHPRRVMPLSRAQGGVSE